MKGDRLMPLIGIVKELKDVRSMKDRRKKVDRYIVAYKDDGYEYRKSFELERGAFFYPPFSLTRCLKTHRVTIKE